MNIEILKDGVKKAVNIDTADEVFIIDGTDILPLTAPEHIKDLHDLLRDFMERNRR